MPPLSGISSPPCITFVLLICDGAVASLPAWGSPNLELNWTGLQELDSSKNLTQQVYMELDPA
jgi:hypothetical protein